MLSWTHFIITMCRWAHTSIRWTTIIGLTYWTMLWYAYLFFNIGWGYKWTSTEKKIVRVNINQKLGCHPSKKPNNLKKNTNKKKNLRLCPCGLSATLSPTVAYKSEFVSNWFGSEIGISGKLRCGTFIALNWWVLIDKMNNVRNLLFISWAIWLRSQNFTDLLESVISLIGTFASKSPPIEMVWFPFARFSSGFLIFTIPSKPSSSLLREQ